MAIRQILNYNNHHRHRNRIANRWSGHISRHFFPHHHHHPPQQQQQRISNIGGKRHQTEDNQAQKANEQLWHTDEPLQQQQRQRQLLHLSSNMLLKTNKVLIAAIASGCGSLVVDVADSRRQQHGLSSKSCDGNSSNIQHAACSSAVCNHTSSA
ncbi:GM19028 [Drosophila sechellia]|uniref:GM19028 n=1 Tax=Drosophila sechellia TaxID=7238 RepID=B4HX44_DROSE|nr:GM19028 [Drosophila sechellia]